MLTSAECLAKAHEMDDLASQSAHQRDRETYSQTADGWRKVAQLAGQQEVWEALNWLDR
jgi:hypothetical protein